MLKSKAYQILQLDSRLEPFSLKDLKKQYFRRAIQLHPDKNPSSDANTKFQELQEAYQYILTLPRPYVGPPTPSPQTILTDLECDIERMYAFLNQSDSEDSETEEESERETEEESFTAECDSDSDSDSVDSF